ncbi:hypothetical protein B0H65DRAFT_149104 [Neurospora tetraspora]|uniref:Uncharacterized protein n=1 Tax=Neurospora tetraspora TaxID=94610 RepID=A0AAE0JH80_9PEZI|nr:hypothetical protein B0H65DRAFT_149104 [Neurospora tetraspora]
MDTRQPICPNPDDHDSSPWPADSKRPIHAAPVPQRFVSMPAANMVPNGWMPVPGSHPAFIVPATHQNMAGHVGMVHHHQQHNWGQYAPCIISSPMTPPNPGAVYDAHGRSGSLPQAHAHVAHWPQGQQQHMLYVNPNHTNPVCLRAQQSEKAALAQWYARLSLSETEKSPIPATAIATGTATATSEVPVQQFPSVKQASVPVVADTTAIGATALTVATGATGATRIIMGPDGTTLVPPPDPAHPGCELSMPMAKAMENFSIPHCCNYLQTKDLLRDKIVKQVLENTQEKLMELLQNELDKMSEEDDDSDLDLDAEDEEPEQDSGDWTFEG